MHALVEYINRTMIPTFPRPIWSLYEGQRVFRVDIREPVGTVFDLQRQQPAALVRATIAKVAAELAKGPSFVKACKAEIVYHRARHYLMIIAKAYNPAVEPVPENHEYAAKFWRIDGKPIASGSWRVLGKRILDRYCTPVS